MKCRKTTKSGDRCMSVMLSGPKGLVCPCEQHHSDVVDYNVNVYCTISITPDQLNHLQSRLKKMWPGQEWDLTEVLGFVFNEYIGGGDFAELISQPQYNITKVA